MVKFIIQFLVGAVLFTIISVSSLLLFYYVLTSKSDTSELLFFTFISLGAFIYFVLTSIEIGKSIIK